MAFKRIKTRFLALYCRLEYQYRITHKKRVKTLIFQNAKKSKIAPVKTTKKG